MAREQAQNQLLEDIEAFIPGSENPAIYKRLFSEMSDDDFHEFY